MLLSGLRPEIGYLLTDGGVSDRSDLTGVEQVQRETDLHTVAFYGSADPEWRT
jgi:hypothetical protein